MRLIVGLGNPGLPYQNTRHNAGFLVVGELQKKKLPAGTIVKKSDVFMNQSGTFVKKLADRYKLELKDLYIVHDDLDILLGSYKMQFGKGPKDHNGLASIDRELETDQYWHVRIGIEDRGSPTSHEASRGKEYVLQDFTDEERKILDGVIKEVCKKLAMS